MNINGRNKKSFDKHRLIKAVHGMDFTQLVNEVTRPVSGTCLDHIYSNHSLPDTSYVIPSNTSAQVLPMLQ